MKTWKQNTFHGFLAILAISYAFTACDNNKDQTKDPLTGTVNIGGIMREGQQADVSVTGTNGTGAISYQWTRTEDGQPAMNISAENGVTYTITDADVGYRLGAIVGYASHPGETISGLYETKVVAAELEPRTYDIKLKNDTLKFEVQYKEKSFVSKSDYPEYMDYLKQRLEMVVNSQAEASVVATDNLINQGGNNHTIVVEYADDIPVYDGLVWDAKTRTFKIHNDFICTAKDTNLSLGSIRNAFEAVEIAMLRLNTLNTIHMAMPRTVPDTRIS